LAWVDGNQELRVAATPETVATVWPAVLPGSPVPALGGEERSRPFNVKLTHRAVQPALDPILVFYAGDRQVRISGIPLPPGPELDRRAAAVRRRHTGELKVEPTAGEMQSLPLYSRPRAPARPTPASTTARPPRSPSPPSSRSPAEAENPRRSTQMATPLDRVNEHASKFADTSDLDLVKWMAKDNQKRLEKALKTPKVKRDPLLPKKGRSGWQIFVEHERAAIKTDNPEVLPQQVLVLCSERWKALDTDGKKPWDDRSRKECAVQRQLIEEYRARPDEAEEAASAEE
jgi:hypothetical protein